MFTPSRLRLARKRRGFSKTRLANLVGVSQRMIVGYEAGEYEPSDETLSRLARVLDFEEGFFSAPDLPELTADNASFRSMSRMTAGQRDAALGAGEIAFALSDWIEASFDLPEVKVLDLRGETPEAAAIMLRQHWGIGELAIKNMVHLLEANGVRVFSLAEDSLEVDAFSVWHKDKPFVFLNTLKSAEHGRFDAAHELGHLVLHRHGGPHIPNAEKEANAFASAFLMPRSSILATAPRLPTVKDLIRYKKNWIVSVAALNYRMHDIGLISDWHYRTLCVEISQLGYRKHEPEGAHRETSQILYKIFSALRKDDITRTSIAKELHLTVKEFEKYIFGLVPTSVPGGGDGSGSKSKANLKVIKS